MTSTGYVRNFNPRSHEGSDTDSSKAVGADIISIHAPTRGATDVTAEYAAYLQFQSTLPRGERLDWLTGWYKSHKFQSTLPRGERPGNVPSLALSPVFQSTLPRGERHLFGVFGFQCFIISIHAPTRGATTGGIVTSVLRLYFNPRSHEGSDRYSTARTIAACLFQSTLPRGERRFIVRMISGKILFQSTLPRGERQ